MPAANNSNRKYFLYCFRVVSCLGWLEPDPEFDLTRN
jgi:hypothetical protein